MADLNEIFGSESENEEMENEEVNKKVEEDSNEEVENQDESGEEDEQEEDSDNEQQDEEKVEQEDEETEEQQEDEEEVEQEEEEAEDQQQDDDEHEEAEQEDKDDDEERKEDSDNDQTNVDDDDDDDEIVSKRAKKNDVDVFGEELDDLSDDSNSNKEEEETENNTQSQIHIEQEEEEVEPEQLINIEIPRVKTDLGKESHFVKLPNFLSVEPRPFDTETYEDDLLEKSETVDEEGQARVRLKVENTIRWRYEKDNEGNLVKQSNAKIVKWSDGSLSMYLGNEIFDVYKTFMQGDHNHLFVRQGNVLHGQTIFKTKLTFRPHSTDSMTHRKMTMSLVDRGSKLKKVKILTEIKKNPEQNRIEMIKKEEEKLKAASRRQQQQRRIREKSHSKGLSANYLEDKYNNSDDDDTGISLSAIKNNFSKNKYKSRKEVYSSSDESENERRLNRVKQNEDNSEDDDDEDEDDIYSKKSKMTKKKKVKHVVSDDDDED